MNTLTLLLLLAGCSGDTTADSGTAATDSGTPSGDDTGTTDSCELDTWWPDSDGDGYGDADADVVEACEAPDDHVGNDRDCDDADDGTYPGVTDDCDDADSDCDGTVDEDSEGGTVLYADEDGDGWGDEDAAIDSCTTTQDGHVDQPGDCDDGEPAVNPGESEVCNDGLDNDCDGTSKPCGLLGNATLDDAEGLYLGTHSGAAFGANGAGVGDLDGDGAGDFVVAGGGDGFWDGEEPGLPFYVGYGQAGATSAPSLTEIGNDLGLVAAVSAAGLDDVDGDGGRELLIGAPDGIFSSGTGSAALFRVPPKAGATLSRDAEIIRGSSTDAGSTGMRVGNVGDLDADGVSDFAVSAPFELRDSAYLDGLVGIFTQGVPASGLMEDADMFVRGTHEDWLGIGLAGVGDTDGDGFDDLLLGAPGASVGSNYYAGEATLYLGPLSTKLESDDADVLLQGSTSESYLGGQVSVAGDVNGDGFADLWVAGFGDRTSAEQQNGHVHLLLGPLDPAAGLGGEEALIVGEPGDTLGWSLDGTGDFDGDGVPDLVVGAHEHDDGNTTVGQALLFYGPLTGTYRPSDAHWTVLPGSRDRGVGITAVSAGDTNADGLDDLLIGASGSERAGTANGAVGLFWGSGL